MDAEFEGKISPRGTKVDMENQVVQNMQKYAGEDQSPIGPEEMEDDVEDHDLECDQN